MKIPIYQVDAFASRVFTGNPAAVCPLEAWLPTLQAIAAENNLSETAYLIGRNGEYAIRWFSPMSEVDLCGHATLASAHVVLSTLEPGLAEVSFSSRSGRLTVTRDGDLLSLDFPTREPAPCPAPDSLVSALGRPPSQVLASRDLMAVYDTADDVLALRPDMAAIVALDTFGVIVTAPGRDCDFVSRFFAPAEGVPEDPVCGSAHCSLIPFWAKRLGKTRLQARQLSSRGGELFCEHRGDRVAIAGRAVKYLEGVIEV